MTWAMTGGVGPSAGTPEFWFGLGLGTSHRRSVAAAEESGPVAPVWRSSGEAGTGAEDVAPPERSVLEQAARTNADRAASAAARNHRARAVIDASGPGRSRGR